MSFKIIKLLGSILFAFVLLSCTSKDIATTQTSISTPSKVYVSPTPTSFPTLLPEAAATFFVEVHQTAFPIPTSLAGFPTAQIPNQNYYQEYLSIPELHIGSYVIRNWRTNNSSYGDIITISVIGKESITIESAILNPLTGIDITGDNIPEAIVETDTKGNGCCHSVAIFSLGNKLETLLDTPTRECTGEFSDLDSDGKYEYITCDGSYNGAFECPHSASPKPLVIFKYSDKEKGFKISTSEFPDMAQERIDEYTKMLELPNASSQSEESVCLVSGLALEYLYTGRQDLAWSTIDKFYEPEKAKQIRSEIESTIEERALFYSPP
ncbi:MAG: hypothetical protein H6635_00120 [Anaerolineales bacterium]|nr:hypothetical protein [Anaerolineales bacterium]